MIRHSAGGSGTGPSMPAVAPIPDGLTSPGATGAPFVAALDVAELPAGAMRRVSFGDLDLLLAHTTAGIVATDDRCPHQSAPLSLGQLEGCLLTCPLHDGRFDLATGNPIQMPTMGGLWPDGTYSAPWSPSGSGPKVDPPGVKSEARRITRVRRLRYYPVRISNGRIEVAVPV
jgi:3-phenylpropionate/trans-cinnamate dioxygenase ferredoxin subunit